MAEISHILSQLGGRESKLLGAETGVIYWTKTSCSFCIFQLGGRESKLLGAETGVIYWTKTSCSFCIFQLGGRESNPDLLDQNQLSYR